jgi:hypothetical protein
MVWSAEQDVRVLEHLGALRGVLDDEGVTLLLTRCDLGTMHVRLHECLQSPLALAELNDDVLAVQSTTSESRMCLAKHEYHYPTHTHSQWELEVWGDPWRTLCAGAASGVG